MLAIGTIRNVLKQAWCLAFTCSEHTTAGKHVVVIKLFGCSEDMQNPTQSRLFAGKFLAHQQATHLPFEVTAEQVGAVRYLYKCTQSKLVTSSFLLFSCRF